MRVGQGATGIIVVLEETAYPEQRVQKLIWLSRKRAMSSRPSQRASAKLIIDNKELLVGGELMEVVVDLSSSRRNLLILEAD